MSGVREYAVCERCSELIRLPLRQTEIAPAVVVQVSWQQCFHCQGVVGAATPADFRAVQQRVYVARGYVDADQ